MGGDLGGGPSESRTLTCGGYKLLIMPMCRHCVAMWYEGLSHPTLIWGVQELKGNALCNQWWSV